MYNDAKFQVRGFWNEFKHTFPMKKPSLATFDDFNPFFNLFKFYGINLNCVVDTLDHDVIIKGDVKAAWNEFVTVANKEWKPCMEIDYKPEQRK